LKVVLRRTWYKIKKVVLCSLFVNASLTKLDVRFNAIGAEGEKALRYAVKGREGFDLQA
jgi:hypothetical protein